MSVGATESVGYGLTAPATTATTNTSSLGDKDTFLQLMVAQMKYQDPLNPTDSSEFLAQTAQFTALEKMQSVADQTAMLLSTQLSFGASNLIGQTVRWYDQTGAEQSGVVQGTTFLASGPVLSVDGHEVAMTDVLSVGSAPTIQPTSTTDPSTTDPSTTTA